MIATFHQYLLETEALLKKGKNVLVGDRPLKGLSLRDVKENIVIFHAKEDNMLWSKGYTLVFFMDSDESAKKVGSGEYYYPMFPVKTTGNMFTVNPITDIWKRRGTHGEKHTLGTIEAFVDEEQIYIDMLSVRPGFKMNHIASFMIDALKEEFPDRKKLWSSKRTEDGAKFFNMYHPGAEENIPVKYASDNAFESSGLSWNDFDRWGSDVHFAQKAHFFSTREIKGDSKFIPVRDEKKYKRGGWIFTIDQFGMKVAGNYDPTTTEDHGVDSRVLFKIDNDGHYKSSGEMQDETAYRFFSEIQIENWKEIWDRPSFQKWWKSHRGGDLGKDLGVAESKEEKIDISKKFSYWKKVLNQNPNKNKFALQVLDTIEQDKKATQRQIDAIEKHVRGDNTRYSSKN